MAWCSQTSNTPLHEMISTKIVANIMTRSQRVKEGTPYMRPRVTFFLYLVNFIQVRFTLCEKRWHIFTHCVLNNMANILQTTFWKVVYYFAKKNGRSLIEIALRFVSRVLIVRQWFSNESVIVVHCTEWCIVGYGPGALWDMWIRSIVHWCLFFGNPTVVNPHINLSIM